MGVTGRRLEAFGELLSPLFSEENGLCEVNSGPRANQKNVSNSNRKRQMQTTDLELPKPAVSSLSLTRDWLFGSYTLEYQLSVDLRPGQLSILIDEIIQALLPPEVLAVSASSDALVTIEDLKGRDPANLLTSTAPDSMPRQDELLYLRGVAPKTASRNDELFNDPFEVRLHTSFREFTANNHISQSVQFEQQGALPTNLRLKHLGRAFPLVPTDFRIGIDLFTRSTMLGWFSGTPTVTQSLLIEASANVARLQITAEKLRSRGEIPLLSSARQQALQKALLRTIGFDWLSDLARGFQGQLS